MRSRIILFQRDLSDVTLHSDSEDVLLRYVAAIQGDVV